MNTWMINLQNSNSPIYDMMIFFHDSTLMIMILIMMLISYIMFTMMFNKLINRYLMKNHLIEMIWTIIPMGMLIFITLPSIKILYMTDEIINYNLTLKTIGHQWFWSYEYTNFLLIEFNSFMIQPTQLNNFRLLDVDNRCILPFNMPIRIITSSSDVIHSWTIPSLGIKMDSIPGRLNQSLLFMNRPGMYFGQCSEICGINHSFMPIVIESTNIMNFINWILTFKIN